MAIAYRASNSATNNATCSVPAGTADGDLLVAVVCSQSGTITDPTGWAEVDNFEINTGQYVYVGYIIVSGTPPASYTWTGMTGNILIHMQAFSGVGTYGGAASASLANSTSCNFGSVTPDEDGCLLWLGGGGFHANGCSTPSGYSNTFTGAQSSCPDYFDSSQVQVTAAATGTITSTGWSNFATLTQRGTQMWFRPAAGGGGSANPWYYYAQAAAIAHG